MKKMILCALMCASVLFPRIAQGYQDCCFDEEPDCCYPNIDLQGLYVAFTGGASIPDIQKQHRISVHTNTGYFLSGAIGYDWCYGFRTEAEVGYHRANLRHFRLNGERFRVGGHISSISYMANAYYDIPICFCLTPYVGGGIGYGQNRRSVSDRHGEQSFERRKNGFSWQVIAGLTYELTCNIDLSAEYRYYKPRIHRAQFHDINLQARYRF